MNQLAEKSLKTLEYYAVLQMLSEQCVSARAKEMALELRPLTDREEAEIWLSQTTDAKDLIMTKGAPAFSGIRDVTAALKRCQRGGVLNPTELLAVASLLRTSRLVRGYMDEIDRKTSFDAVFNRLSANRYLEEKISNAIISEEEIADGASSALADIRRQMRLSNNKVRETLNRIITSSAYSKYLQDTIVTQRGDRYVIPVKSEHRGDVPGMIHDVSASGATIFVEPSQVVEVNNQLRVLASKEKAEIERILAELSAEVGSFSESIGSDFEALCLLDFIFAKGKLSYKLNACAPKLMDGYSVNLVKARHPLLAVSSAVPIDIAIGEEYDTLVITGPNTGGKTVSLKTLGLLCLMAASGLHIPANEQSHVCLFENIFADIGDEQSIEQSLSTFSSHMKNIVSIVADCKKGDLILFDELGAGTDPVEGAALAVAIIEFSRQMCALVAATTHYSELKVFALTTDRVENASCEFDVNSLKPTYRLMTGIPGKSNAFAISSRLGLPDTIIDRAKEQLSAENARFEDVLETLERERKQLEKYKAEADRLRRTAQSEKDKALSLKDRTEDETERILQKARDKADSILKDARMTADTVFLELEDLKKKARENVAEQNLAQARAMLRGAIGEAETKVRKTKEKRTVSKDEIRPLKAGDEVTLLNVGVNGTVLAPADAEGNLQVQAGILKLTVKINEVKPVAAPAKPKPRTYRTASGGITELRRAAAPRELDVRGMSADEALLEVDQFISACLLAHLETATIIHGKGTGVLRAAVQKHLQGQKCVKSHRPGHYGEGETGVTVIEFR